MNYTVTWKPSAEQDLARLWLAAADRQAVADAANRIDALLQTDAEQRGESRSGATRILFEPPLAVLFEVQAQAGQVEVLKVWRTT